MAFEKQLDSKRIYEGRVVNLRVDTVQLQNGKETTREVIDHQGAAAIVAFDEDGRLLLVRQYRYPMAQELLELPAGKIDPGESPLECARRELTEETGYRAEKFTQLGKIYPAAAYDAEVVYLFFAEGLTAAAQHLDEDEFLTVERMDLGEALDMVMEGEIPDSKTQIGILKINNIRQELC